MEIEIVKDYVQGVPYMNFNKAAILYDFIVNNKLSNILELGAAHGTSSCYIAAALDKIGLGKLTCVDLILDSKRAFKPSIEDQINGLNLGEYVSIHRMKTGYNWFLHNEIKSCSNNFSNICSPKYDLVIIDGSKNWTIDSSSFFLADKLLKPNGWIIWDDYSWTYSAANKKRESTDGVLHSSMSEEERNLPHIKEIFDLLVKQHPNYSHFQIDILTDWAWAQKKQS